jgi:hypothetical protein
MDRVGFGLLAGLLGGAAGAVAVRYVAPPPAGEVRAESAGARLSADEVREIVAEIRRQTEHPATASLGSARAGGDAPASRPPLDGGTGVVPGATPGTAGTSVAVSPEIEALVARAAEKAAQAAIERQAAKAKAEEPAPKKSATLAEVAHEIGLSAAQETEIREAYREATDRALKLMSEPDGDPEALRKELTDAKGDRGKITAITFKYMPKLLGKLPEFMSLQSDRDARIHKALGSEDKVDEYERYSVAEEDPFGFGGAKVSVGRTR